jgi:hypothetical protein
MINKQVLFIALLFIPMLSFSQTAKDYERKYESGKQLLKQGQI